MTRRERFLTAVRGGEPDRPPVSVWLHFASEHLPPERVAELHLAYQRAYDWDFVKVMNDYRLPLGRQAPASAEALQAVAAIAPDREPLTTQLEVIRRLREALGPEVPIVETLFDPLQTLLRSAGGSVLALVRQEPAAARRALEAVAETLRGYLGAAREAGADGVFYSLNWATRPEAGGLEDREFRSLIEPLDRSLLEAAEGMVRIGHVHGVDLDFRRVADLPLEAFNWSHRHTAPSLAEARELTGRAVIGGIDEIAFASQTLGEAELGIRRAVAETGRQGLLIGPGCTVPPDTPQRLLLGVRRMVEGLA
ncbi:MAG TPA: uroporphyrinogen decarboxylase family protein [Trueperaceae bacterium]|nr:uroporphyrinogen decarboxylase family protein [Trueperaceae bacterium]